MKLGARQYTLGATALGSSLAFIDASAVIVALPTMQKELDLGLTGEQWIFLSYSLALASLYLIGGALGDRFGRRKLFVWGVLVFVLASVLAGLAPNGFWLIVARVIQGVGGAFVTTNSLAWLRSSFADEAGRAIGIWTSLTGISTIIAPPLGGALTQWLSWRWIFFINLPLGVLVLFLASKGVTEEKPAEQKRPLDPLGSVLIAAGFGFLVYYLVQGARDGFSELWWSLLIGSASLLAFILLESRIKSPILPFKLFRIRNFWAANLETLLLYGALSGIMFYLTLYLQFLGLSPLTSSLFLVPVSIVLILLSPYFGGLADRQGPRLLLSLGPLLIAIGAFFFSLIDSRSEIWVLGLIGLALFSLGLSMIVSPITSTALKSAPSSFSGVASGLNNTLSRIGGLVTVAVFGLIVSVIFYGAVPERKATPLEVNQGDPTVRSASVDGFQAGMKFVTALALASAATGWFAISNKGARQKS